MKTIHAVIITGACTVAIAGGGIGTASAAGVFDHTTTIVERVATASAPVRAKPSPRPSTSPSVATAKPTATAQAPASPSPSQALPPIIVAAEGYSGMRPTMVDSSADGNGAVTGITWSEWNSSEAVGYGNQRHNDCDPDCGQGTITYSPVEIVLGGVTGSSPMDGGQYTTISVTDTDGSEDPAWGAGPQPVSAIQNADGGEQGNY